MNIFVLDLDHATNASYHCDRHVVKMILESAQLLCTALWSQNIPAIYRATHKNHPCAVWVRSSLENFEWCTDYAMALICEYGHRYGKTHKSMNVVCDVLLKQRQMVFPAKELTPFALAMPDVYKTGDPVQSYRNYYNGAKRHLFKWTNRPVPEWIEPCHGTGIP